MVGPGSPTGRKGYPPATGPTGPIVPPLQNNAANTTYPGGTVTSHIIHRLYGNENTVNRLLQGFWPTGKFHIDPDCRYLKGKNPVAIDGGLMQNFTRATNWFLVLHGEPVAHVCMACARNHLSRPVMDQRHLRAEIARRAVDSARNNP